MHRLTTNKDVSEMSMYELAHNACYSKDGLARYRDFEMDTDARDFARNLMTTLIGYDLPVEDDEFDEEMMENLQYDPFNSVTGLVALFYRNLWAMADLRETLKAYEDAEERESKWIQCSERLPEESLHSVIGWDAYRERCVFVQYIGGRFVLGDDTESVKITHWMNVPIKPKGD